MRGRAGMRKRRALGAQTVLVDDDDLRIETHEAL